MVHLEVPDLSSDALVTTSEGQTVNHVKHLYLLKLALLPVPFHLSFLEAAYLKTFNACIASFLSQWGDVSPSQVKHSVSPHYRKGSRLGT